MKTDADRGAHYLSVRYSQRLDENVIAASVDPEGENHDCEMLAGLPGRVRRSRMRVGSEASGTSGALREPTPLSDVILIPSCSWR